jgi:ABC-type transporter Mla subunit MlaD
MNEFRRNLIVGVFFLVALVLLGIMTILFGQAPQFLASGYTISIFFPSAGPIQNDDPIYINGLQVGQVKWIEPLPDLRQGVKVVCFINQRKDQKIDIPIDAKPLIKEQSIGFGSPAIRIEVGPENSKEILPKDGTGVLHGSVAGGIAEVIPKSIMDKLENTSDALTDLARALKPVADDLHVLFRPLSTQAVDTATGPHRPMANISTAVQRLDEALKGFNAIIADPNNQQNIAVMVKNFKTVSERGITLSDNLINLSEQLKKTAGTTDDKINKIASGLIENTDKLSQLFDKLNGVAEKISTGQGTFAKMHNDPEFYDALTDTAKRLQLAADDLRQLLLQWQDKGLKIQGGLLGK